MMRGTTVPCIGIQFKSGRYFSMFPTIDLFGMKLDSYTVLLSVGVVAAQAVVDHFTCGQLYFAGWPSAWLVFAGYALVVTVLFALLFKEKKMA